MKIRFLAILIFIAGLSVNQSTAQTSAIKDIISRNYSTIENLYKHFHQHPELSLNESETSAKMVQELEKLDFEVTENIGGHGLVAVMKNGEGPTVMVRADLDALPIKEETGASFSSDETAVNSSGEEVPVMHACGHDIHMSVLIGTATVLSERKTDWNGTIILIGQPAEEVGIGAKAMIEDGLFRKFPRPDYILALHVNSAMASGNVGYTSGYGYANVDSGQITVYGRGGHGAYPDLTVDPIVLASQLTLDLQTIISREISALDPAVISVGAIHGGTGSNIIPNEVKLDFTVRTFKDEVREKIIKKIQQTCEGIGRSAGLPSEQWPQLDLDDNHLPSLYNDPDLAQRIANTFENVLGEQNVREITPVLYGEDFARYGRVTPQIPILMYSLGSQKPEDIRKAEAGLINLPSTHSSKYLPDTEPTIKTGVLTMSSAVLELLND